MARDSCPDTCARQGNYGALVPYPAHCKHQDTVAEPLRRQTLRLHHSELLTGMRITELQFVNRPHLAVCLWPRGLAGRLPTHCYEGQLK
jgi:hypothetical protein